MSPDSDVILWTEDFDPWAQHQALPTGVAGVALEPVELRIARSDSQLPSALTASGRKSGLTAERALESIALAALRVARERVGRGVEVELPAPPSIARSSSAIVAFAEAARRVDGDVTIGLPCTRSGTEAVEELTARGVKTSIEIWSHEDLSPAAQSFITGLQRRTSLGRSLRGLTSVAWLRLQPLRAAVTERLPTSSTLADSLASAAGQACYLTATRLFRGSCWHQLCDLGGSPLRPGFRALDDGRGNGTADAAALALPGAALMLGTGHESPAAELEADETTITWTLDQAAKEGVDLAALGGEIRARALQRSALLERAALTRLAELLPSSGEDLSEPLGVG